ncbi:MAG: hypothetical protein KGL13_05025 [Gammaproteobacteria bacterium]|nr:hypothetical protein [Gammaproteobacteria bacterium]MDE2345810.1 hypothetical protein [Gammaproteobacteria bacterium]
MNFCRLRCPECGESNLIPLQVLAVGHQVMCANCAAGLYLNHVRPTPDAEPEWQLESTAPYEEERRSS